MSAGTGRDDYWDPIIYIFVAGIVGIPLLTKLSAQVTTFLVDVHVLTTDNVLIPITDGVGLDIGRTLIAGAVIALTVLGLIWSVRRRVNSAKEVKK